MNLPTDVKCVSRLLAALMYNSDMLPPLKIIKKKALCVGELVAEPNGVIKLNYPSANYSSGRTHTQLFTSFARRYYTDGLCTSQEEWGTQDHMQQFINDHTLTDASIDQRKTCCTLTFKNGNTVPITKRINNDGAVCWDTPERSSSYQNGYHRSEHDTRSKKAMLKELGKG